MAGCELAVDFKAAGDFFVARLEATHHETDQRKGGGQDPAQRMSLRSLVADVRCANIEGSIGRDRSIHGFRGYRTARWRLTPKGSGARGN